MKRLFIIIVAFLMAQSNANADSWCINRNSCWGFLSNRFHAYAKTSVFSGKKYQTGYDCVGRWMGYGLYGGYSTLCSNNSKGCSRPRTATCGPNSGTVSDQIWSGCYLLFASPQPYYAYAKAQNLTSGWSNTATATGRGSAGQTGEFMLDEQIFNSLNDDGFSHNEISGEDISIASNQTLKANNINGVISIGKSSDYYSTFKIIVIKERNDLNKSDQLLQDSLLSVGVFNNIVYTAEITVSKDNIRTSGVFSNNSSVRIFENGDSIGVKIDRLSLNKDLGIELAENEELTVITYSDGGFDISSAIIQPVPMMAKLSIENIENLTANIYPNPSSSFINIELKNPIEEANASIHIIDIAGRNIAKVYNGTLTKGSNQINNIDISNLPNGLYIIEIKTQNQTIYSKFSKK